MTRIYTKTGDAGQTSLFGGGRVPKSDVRVDAYGEVDELNAALGVARTFGHDAELDTLLQTAQARLFTLGSMLATPKDSKAWEKIPKLKPEWVAEMEAAIDRCDEELPALTSFILPGGSKLAAQLHLCRTICRRAERRLVPLHAEGRVDPDVVVFVNRLSDLLFTLARVANHRAHVKDVPWTP